LVLIFILRYEKPKFYFHKIILSLPLLSKLFKNYSLTEFSRNLAILLETGISGVEALKLSGESLTNYVYRKKIMEISNFFAKGHNLSELLDKEKKLFPYQFTKMISIGEKTGTLSNTLIYLAKNYEDEININLERFVNSLEPIILIIVAAIVAFMALAIILPIYELSDKLSK
jgi:type II secretory pathway component PulF